MTLDIILAKIAIEIMRSGRIGLSTCDLINNFNMSYDDEVELFNTVFIPHRRRYELCFDNTSMINEASLLCEDYLSIRNKCSSLHIGEELLLALFRFATIRDVFSGDFREICVGLQQEVRGCESLDVQVAICTRVVSMIVRCHLYGRQPFDDILETFVSTIEQANSRNANIKQISLLE